MGSVNASRCVGMTLLRGWLFVQRLKRLITGHIAHLVPTNIAKAVQLGRDFNLTIHLHRHPHPNRTDRLFFASAAWACDTCYGDSHIDTQPLNRANGHAFGCFLTYRAIFAEHAGRDAEEFGFYRIIIGNNTAFKRGRGAGNWSL